MTAVPNTETYTPGPWVILDDHPQRSAVHIVAEPGCHDIATLYSAPEDWEKSKQDESEVWRDDDGRMANARLIAAAPELLEALQAVVAIADRKTDEFDRAHAAMAKATGVAQ